MTSADKETTPMMEEVTEDEYSDRFDEEEGELPTHGQQGDNVYRSGKKNSQTAIQQVKKNPPTGGVSMSTDQVKTHPQMGGDQCLKIS